VAATGTQSAGVARVVARFTDSRGRPRALRFVMKRLEGEPAREVAVYRSVVAAVARDLSPAMLGAEEIDPGSWLLLLEPVRPALRWPWRGMHLTGRVLERLAELHGAPSGALAMPAWDYERALLDRGRELVALLDSLPRAGELARVHRSLPAIRRVVAALPAMRRALLELPSLGQSVIHGDVHTGNVIVARRGAGEQPVLLDWGRARIGSPLEDVSSWLQSLAYWEPEARRRHDTLLGAYLAARGLSRTPARGLRDAYWTAAASNVLAGALLFHLKSALQEDAPTRRAAALRAAALRAAEDGLRIVRRADACWRAGGAAGR